MTTLQEIFYSYVFDGVSYPKQDVEAAAVAMRSRLKEPERKKVNAALLARLAAAKEAHGPVEQRKELLADPQISTLVNTLVLINQAWLHKVITRNRALKPHLLTSSAEELHSLALAGGATREADASGMIGAILEFDYRRYGASNFSGYLERAISHALHATHKQQQTYAEVYAKAQHIAGEEMGEGWADRKAKSPETGVIQQELLEVLQDVISRLPTEQQRFTAKWLIEQILDTGMKPRNRDIAAAQKPPVSREEGRKRFQETIDSIGRQIEKDYPHLAQEGINGWEEFLKVIGHSKPGREPSRC